MKFSTGNIGGNSGDPVLTCHGRPVSNGEGVIETDFHTAEFGAVGGAQSVKGRDAVGTTGSAPIAAEIHGKNILNTAYHQAGASAGTATTCTATACTATAGVSGTQVIRDPAVFLVAGNCYDQ